MRMYSKWLLIVGAGLGLFALPCVVANADDKAPVKSDQPLQFPAGFQNVSGAPSGGVYSTLGTVTERALTKGDFYKVLDELASPDKDRTSAFKAADQSKLDAQIDRIRQLWQSKYGKDFAIDNKIAFGAPLLIIPGEVTDSAAALANWPVPATPEQAQTAAAKNHPVPAQEVKKDAKDRELEKGRHVALVRFPGMHGKAELTVSMIHELPMSWRIDIPDDRTGAQIYNDLLVQLTAIADHSDKWPADVNEAGRGVAYHVLSALYGANVTPPAKG